MLRDQGAAATADAALRQPGQQVLRPPPIEQRVRCVSSFGAKASARCLSFTRCQRSSIEDAQLGHFLNDPLALGIGPGHALAGLWVLDEPLPTQTSRPTYSSLLKTPLPRFGLPWIVLGPQALPNGPGMPSLFKAQAIARDDLPSAIRKIDGRPRPRPG